MNRAKELVLIAQDSTNYGLDLYGERSIAKLLTRLARIPSLEWIRLMYAYPAKFPLDLLDVMANEEKIVPYLDIPVQHASTAVLKSMRRGITRRATEDLISKIRERVPGIALRTTLITGYPAEGDREFEELEEFVEQMQFDRLGVFTYSQEDGTTAHPLGDPIPAEEKLQRQARLYDIQAEISLAKNLAKVGSFDKVLIERKSVAGDMDDAPLEGDAEYYYGRTSSHAPEVDGEVRITSQKELVIGDFAHVRITGANDYELQAEMASSKNL
jgi:ribosomal protein S12 methylthiotransferase